MDYPQGKLKHKNFEVVDILHRRDGTLSEAAQIYVGARTLLKRGGGMGGEWQEKKIIRELESLKVRSKKIEGLSTQPGWVFPRKGSEM
jgi:hypothetical protein